MFDLESSINKWLKTFRGHRAFNHGSIREMELHLRDHIDDLIAGGLSEKEAFDKAVNEFGDITPMANEEFTNIRSPRTIRSFFHGVMLKSYFKISLRSMLRNPLSSFINIFGLSVAIGICLVVYSFLEFDYSIDDYHEHGNEVYLVTYFVDRDGTIEQNGTAPRPLGEMIKQDYSQVEKMCRIEDRPVVIKNGDKVFHENIRIVDSDFLDMFSFPLKWGLKSSLQDLNSIILSEKMSVKYFGDENPVGQDILMVFDQNRSKIYKVTGVAKVFPDAHIIDFDFLINFDNIKLMDPGYDLNDWSEFIRGMLVMVNEPADLEVIKDGMNKYQKLQNEVQQDWPITGFGFVSLANLHNESVNIRNDISYNDSAPGRIFLPIFAIFILVLACINYMNMAIVSSARRLKEIGIRKVVGASRGKVIFQFLSENVFLTVFAFIFGLLLAFNLFLPWFSEISQRALSINLVDMNLWIFIFIVLLFTGIISGMYPAFYISKFQATTIFKGTVRFGKKNPLTKVFLSFQLIVACILITGAVVFTQNNHYQNNRSWGYDQKNTLYSGIQDYSVFQQFEAKLLENPNVLSISGSKHHLGKPLGMVVATVDNRQYELKELAVAPGYMETMDLRLKQGRFFKRDHESDYQAVVVNEKLVENLGYAEPIGEVFKMDSTQYEIIGVVNNFYYYNFYYDLQPALIRLAKKEEYAFLSLRVKEGTREETYEAMQKEWLTLFPDVPFNGGHQEDTWGIFFDEVDTQETFMKTTAMIAIILASLGLYGLVTLNVTGRVREFSIRKILGAGLGNLAGNITRQYVWLTLVAIIIGVPVSYLFVDALMLEMYPEPMPMTFFGIFLSVIILISTLLAVVSTQIRKVTRSNPVEGLKVE